MKSDLSRRQPNTSARCLALGGVFALVCLVYVIVLGVIQYQGAKNLPTDDGLTVRKHTVAGQRGEIYDTNGVLLVGNKTSYDLIYEYDAMPDTYREINATLLSLSSALEQTGNGDKRGEDYFVLEGTYPNMSFRAEVYDRDSEERYWYDRFLADAGYEEEIDAGELCRYFVKSYQISESLYSNEEITRLIRLWYDMKRIGFSSYTYYTLAQGINEEMIQWVNEQHTEGATVLTTAVREYRYPGYATHVLGSVGRITAETVDRYLELGYSLDATVGVSGCEEAFESYLRSENGIWVEKYNEKGELVESYYEKEPVSGKDVYLTIDIELQMAAEDSLRDSVEDSDTATSGAVVAQDPETGAVRALASYPTYDLTLLKDQSYVDSLNSGNNPWLNRALNGLYAPGSTYKIGVALAALERDHISASTTYTCNHVFHEPFGNTCLGWHGSIDVVEAIRVSCNIFFYSVGELFGLDSVTEYTSRLGLGVPTGIELDEKVGIIAGAAYREANHLTDWTVADDVMGAIGQSDHAYSPLQLNVYLSTIVNGGSRYRAYLLDAVRPFHDRVNTVYQTEPSVLDTVAFGEDTYSILMEGMEKVVSQSDTLSYYFRHIPVSVGGKTGTAETSKNAPSNALFTGFAPLEAPELVVSCIIERGEAGGNAAIPVSAVMDAYFNRDTGEGADE